MTSRFERLSTSAQVLLIGSLVIFPMLSHANTAKASTDQNKTRLVFEINTVNELLNPKPVPIVPTPTVDPNIAILEDYLSTKGSPLAPYAADILQNENWKLVLAISNGESTMCKHQLYNNCWGVGGAWNLRHYSNFAEGFSDVNRFLTEKYVAKGADTPEEIVHRYVGHANGNWVVAVNQILNQIDQLPLVN